MTLYSDTKGLASIITNCISSKGRGFEIGKESKFEWEERFICEEKLFRYVWKIDDLNEKINHRHGRSALMEWKKEFSKYENVDGIDIKEQTTIIEDERKRGGKDFNGRTARIRYLTTIRVFVTDTCAREIYEKYDGSGLVAIGTPGDLKEALEFKERVENRHKDILPELFDKGASRFNNLSTDGFGTYGYDGNDDFFFKELGMAPLKNIAQALGLAMAVCTNNVPDTQIWFLYKTKSPFSDKPLISIIKHTEKEHKKENLVEW